MSETTIAEGIDFESQHIEEVSKKGQPELEKDPAEVSKAETVKSDEQETTALRKLMKAAGGALTGTEEHLYNLDTEKDDVIPPYSPESQQSALLASKVMEAALVQLQKENPSQQQMIESMQRLFKDTLQGFQMKAEELANTKKQLESVMEENKKLQERNAQLESAQAGQLKAQEEKTGTSNPYIPEVP